MLPALSLLTANDWKKKNRLVYVYVYTYSSTLDLWCYGRHTQCAVYGYLVFIGYGEINHGSLATYKPQGVLVYSR